jgi:uncharacterized repeat protein (TIGR01451 family)/fimbrial isopeptide formation D2 family protein
MLILLGLVFSLTNVKSAWALGTPAGTVITNQATASYNDANGNARPQATSNTVSVTVLAVAAVDVSPPTNTNSTQLGGTAYHAVDITNLGNDTDTLTVSFAELAQKGPDTWTLNVYSDVNRNGVFDSGTDTLIVSGSSTAVPANFDIKTIKADSTFKVIFGFTTPTIASMNDSLQERLTATTKPKSNGTATDSGDYTTIVQAADPKLTKDNDKGTNNVEPGEQITYQIVLSNDGNDTSYVTTLLDTLQTTLVTYTAGSMRMVDGGPPAGTVAAAYALAGPAKTDASDADSLENDGSVLVGNFGKMAPGDTITVYFRVTVKTSANSPATISNKAWTQWKNKNLVPQPPEPSPPKDNPLNEFNGIDLLTVRVELDSIGAPDSLSTNADPGDTVHYQLKLINTGNGDDTYTITYTSTSVPDTVLFYADADSNGIRDNATPISNTGTLAEGATFRFVAYLVIPPGTLDGAVDSTFVTGTSDEDGTKTDTVKLKTTVTAPSLAVQKYVNTSFVQNPASSDTSKQAAPNDTLYYTVVVTNNGTGSATTIGIDDPVSSHTTYIANSTRVQNGNPSSGTGTFINDGSNTTLSGVNVAVSFGSSTLSVDLASMSSTGGGTHVWTIRFKVKIN